MRLGEWLCAHDRITPIQRDAALDAQQEQGGQLGGILIGQGAITDRDLREALAAQYQCDWVDSLSDTWLDRSLIQDLQVDFLRAGPLLPVRRGGQVMVCVADPAVAVRHPELGVLLGSDPEPLLVPEEELLRAIDRCLSLRDQPAGKSPGDAAPAVAGPSRDREDLLRVSGDAPVAARVSRLLVDGLEQGASDVHLEPGGEGMRVRFRVDGILYAQEEIPRDLVDAVVSRIKIMAHLDIAERRLPQDGNARVRVGNREVDIRVSTLPVADGERVVLRLLGRESTRLSLTDLGMPELMLTSFLNVIHRPYGVFWVTGPTGSGKTTTLYAALRELDTRRRNILTIEEPVEYQLPDIGQVGVQPRIGLTFAAGLRSLLRQDPDVILVGETRDEETAEIVIRASMTGHLVLSTLHANDAIAASLRLTDMGVAPYLVAEATQGALGQRLVRRVCPDCQGTGCSRCREGFRGRVGLFELLLVTDTLRAVLRDGGDMESVRSMAMEEGFQDLHADAAAKVAAGITTRGEVRAALGGVE